MSITYVLGALKNCLIDTAMHRTRGGGGGGGGEQGGLPPSHEKLQKYLVTILIQIPWKITKLHSQHWMLSYHQHTSQRHLNGWRMMARLQWYCILSPLMNKKHTKKLVVVGPTLTNLLNLHMTALEYPQYMFWLRNKKFYFSIPNSYVKAW